MRHATTCKFCKNPITVTIDDDYAELGDPLKLLGLAACNTCADLRVERRGLERKIAFACNQVLRAGKMDDDERAEHAKGLSELLQEYAKMIARWHGKEGSCWDEAIVDAILSNPIKWGEVLGRLWTMYRQWESRGETSQ